MERRVLRLSLIHISLIVVKKEAPSAIQEGDIISFYSSDPALDGAVNTHRVTAAEAQPDGS